MIDWIVSSSVLIAVVILLRFALRRKISLRVQYALWALVLVRLLVPVSVGSFSWSAAGAAELLEPVETVVNGAELELFIEEFHEFNSWEEYEAFVEENRSFGITGKMNSEFRSAGSSVGYIWATVPVTVPWNTVLQAVWAAGGIAAAGSLADGEEIACGGENRAGLKHGAHRLVAAGPGVDDHQQLFLRHV